MTLKAIETKFAELLEAQAIEEATVNLTLDGPILSKQLPKLILTRLLFEENMQQETESLNIPGYFMKAYPDMATAGKEWPDIKLKFTGRPWSVYQFMNSEASSALIDFEMIGAVLLSKTPLENLKGSALHDLQMPIWLNYALSPELWGPVGKWTRFHDRLMNLFTHHNLLDGKASLGYYPLQSRAQVLSNHGFIGTLLEKSYLLVPSWTFSLKDLNKLESAIQQEF